MPRTKQKKAIDLPEFLKKDAAIIKEKNPKVRPIAAPSEITPPIIDPPVITQPESAKPEVAAAAVVQPIIAPPKIEKPNVDQSFMLPEKNQKLNKDIWKKIIAGIVLGVLVVLSGTTFYFYYQWRQTKTNPQEVAKGALAEIVAEVGNLIELPTGETPTMATVTSVEKLKDQPFFAKAQNGDKALIYSQSGKAILYRPTSHKIIEVISLIGSSNQLTNNQIPSETQPTTVPEATQGSADVQTPAAETSTEIPIEIPAEIQKLINVAVYNGTSQKGLAGSVAAKISGITEIKVVQTGNAKGNFAKTIVIDLSGNNQALSQKIAETIGGEIGIFPEGETWPEADILIIAGKE